MLKAVTILFLSVLILTLIVYNLLDYGFPVIPGWNVTLYPPLNFLYIFICPWLLFVIGCYIICLSKGKRIHTMSFILYLLLTIPLPITLFYYENSNVSVTPGAIGMMPKFLTTVLLIYLLGQLFFIYQLVKISRKKQM